MTVEDSMSVVHASAGRLKPASPDLKSEPAIVAGIAKATLPTGTVSSPITTSSATRSRRSFRPSLTSTSAYGCRAASASTSPRPSASG